MTDAWKSKAKGRNAIKFNKNLWLDFLLNLPDLTMSMEIPGKNKEIATKKNNLISFDVLVYILQTKVKVSWSGCGKRNKSMIHEPKISPNN